MKFYVTVNCTMFFFTEKLRLYILCYQNNVFNFLSADVNIYKCILRVMHSLCYNLFFLSEKNNVLSTIYINKSACKKMWQNSRKHNISAKVAVLKIKRKSILFLLISFTVLCHSVGIRVLYSHTAVISVLPTGNWPIARTIVLLKLLQVLLINLIKY